MSAERAREATAALPRDAAAAKDRVVREGPRAGRSFRLVALLGDVIDAAATPRGVAPDRAAGIR